MTTDDDAPRGLQLGLAGAAFAFFAADQPLGLEDIAADARARRLSMAAASTPDWFAAAARKSSSLMDVAPELRGLDIEDVDATLDTDLIHIYGTDAVEEPEDETDKDIRWHMLKGLADLD